MRSRTSRKRGDTTKAAHPAVERAVVPGSNKQQKMEVKDAKNKTTPVTTGTPYRGAATDRSSIQAGDRDNIKTDEATPKYVISSTPHRDLTAVGSQGTKNRREPRRVRMQKATGDKKREGQAVDARNDARPLGPQMSTTPNRIAGKTPQHSTHLTPKPGGQASTGFHREIQASPATIQLSSNASPVSKGFTYAQAVASHPFHTTPQQGDKSAMSNAQTVKSGTAPMDKQSVTPELSATAKKDSEGPITDRRTPLRMMRSKAEKNCCPPTAADVPEKSMALESSNVESLKQCDKLRHISQKGILTFTNSAQCTQKRTFHRECGCASRLHTSSGDGHVLKGICDSLKRCSSSSIIANGKSDIQLKDQGKLCFEQKERCRSLESGIHFGQCCSEKIEKDLEINGLPGAVVIRDFDSYWNRLQEMRHQKQMQKKDMERTMGLRSAGATKATDDARVQNGTSFNAGEALSPESSGPMMAKIPVVFEGTMNDFPWSVAVILRFNDDKGNLKNFYLKKVTVNGNQLWKDDIGFKGWHIGDGMQQEVIQENTDARVANFSTG